MLLPPGKRHRQRHRHRHCSFASLRGCKRAINKAAGRDGGRPLQEWRKLLSIELARYTAATVLSATGRKSLRGNAVRTCPASLICTFRDRTTPCEHRVKDRETHRHRHTQTHGVFYAFESLSLGTSWMPVIAAAGRRWSDASKGQRALALHVGWLLQLSKGFGRPTAEVERERLGLQRREAER